MLLLLAAGQAASVAFNCLCLPGGEQWGIFWRAQPGNGKPGPQLQEELLPPVLTLPCCLSHPSLCNRPTPSLGGPLPPPPPCPVGNSLNDAGVHEPQGLGLPPWRVAAVPRASTFITTPACGQLVYGACGWCCASAELCGCARPDGQRARRPTHSLGREPWNWEGEGQHRCKSAAWNPLLLLDAGMEGSG